MSRKRPDTGDRSSAGTHYSQRVGDIQHGKTKDDKKAWKLLNDRRFIK